MQRMERRREEDEIAFFHRCRWPMWVRLPIAFPRGPKLVVSWDDDSPRAQLEQSEHFVCHLLPMIHQLQPRTRTMVGHTAKRQPPPRQLA